MTLKDVKKELAYEIHGRVDDWRLMTIRDNQLRTKVPGRNVFWEHLTDHINEYMEGEKLQAIGSDGVYDDDGFTRIAITFNHDFEQDV